METRSRSHSNSSSTRQLRNVYEAERDDLIQEFNSVIANSRAEEFLQNLSKRRESRSSEGDPQINVQWDEEQKRLTELWAKIKKLNE